MTDETGEFLVAVEMESAFLQSAFAYTIRANWLVRKADATSDAKEKARLLEEAAECLRLEKICRRLSSALS